MSSPTRLRRHAAALALAGCLLSSCGDGNPTSGTSSEKDSPEGAGRVTYVKPADRASAPRLSGETLEGDRLRMADFDRKVLVVNVWGSTCGPCRAEAGELAKVSRETHGKGVRFAGINTRDISKDNARAFERAYKVPYPSWYDPEGRLLSRFPRGSLMPQGIPNTLVIDREGRIAVRILAAVDGAELRGAVDSVVREG
ncbi:TlpA disulfide reductase family protein [Streptomyces sp. NPDC005438]|uniref:TlpA disulfide reductase family protein n=1 Tax=Streptomyces sp. NPDC005438 TaxID=3156880 RepID=UPI0033B48312